MANISETTHEFEQALLSTDMIAARNILKRSRASLPPVQFIDEVMVPALQRIGEGWEKGETALSQVYMSGRICETLSDELLRSKATKLRNHPNIAIAVLNDHHNLGKKLVAAVVRAAGYRLRDYGHGISVEDLFTRTKNDAVEILLISTLMLHSALLVKKLTARIRGAGLKTKVIVGGAPFLFDDCLWREVGADAMGRNASNAVEFIRTAAGASA